MMVPIFIQAVEIIKNKDKSISELKASIFKQFLQLILDVPFVIVFLFLICTLWRVPSLYRKLSDVSFNTSL